MPQKQLLLKFVFSFNLMTRVKVLHFTKVINRNDFIDVIVRYADAERFEMLACTYNKESNIEDPRYAEHGIVHLSLDIQHGWWHLFLGAWRLSKILSQQKVAVLHTHHYYEAIIGRLACWLSPGCRHVIGRHYHNQFYLTAQGFKRWYYLKVENWVNDFADAIIVPSTAIRDLLIQQGAELRKIVVIPYGFDFDSNRYKPTGEAERAQMLEQLGWQGKYIIGNVARHDLIKGQLSLLSAFQEITKQIPESLLVMIGNGPLHELLKQKAKELNLGANVVFLGWRQDAHRLINAMDVVIHPTLQEAFPQVMVETMALGKPIIITPVSGATDVIENDKNGIMIPFNDTPSIVQAAIRILSDLSFSKKLGAEAARWVRQHLDARSIVPQYEIVYERVVR